MTESSKDNIDWEKLFQNQEHFESNVCLTRGLLILKEGKLTLAENTIAENYLRIQTKDSVGNLCNVLKWIENVRNQTLPALQKIYQNVFQPNIFQNQRNSAC